MLEEIVRMIHEEEKMNYVSENTHVDVRDLYQDYLNNNAKQYNDNNNEFFDTWNQNGIRVINTADVWISIYTKAIEINPNDAELYYKRASYYETIGKQDEAILDYSEAIKLKSDYADAYLKRALCYKKKGVKNEAIDDYNNFIKLKPDQAFLAPIYGFITKVNTIAVDIL